MDACLLAGKSERKKWEIGEWVRERTSGFVASSSPPAMQFLCVDVEWVRRRAGGLFGSVKFRYIVFVGILNGFRFYSMAGARGILMRGSGGFLYQKPLKKADVKFGLYGRNKRQ